MAQHQTRRKLDTVDPVWERIRTEAEDVARREPELATFIYASVRIRSQTGSTVSSLRRV